LIHFYKRYIMSVRVRLSNLKVINKD